MIASMFLKLIILVRELTTRFNLCLSLWQCAYKANLLLCNTISERPFTFHAIPPFPSYPWAHHIWQCIFHCLNEIFSSYTLITANKFKKFFSYIICFYQQISNNKIIFPYLICLKLRQKLEQNIADFNFF